MANVLVSPEVQRQVDRLPKVIRARVWQLIQRLRQVAGDQRGETVAGQLGWPV